MVYFNYERWCYRVGIINDRIWERRISLGLTLLNVAEQLGVKEATAQRYESGAIQTIRNSKLYPIISDGMGRNISSCFPRFWWVSNKQSRKKIIIEYRKSDEITQAMVLRALAIDETIEIKRNA